MTCDVTIIVSIFIFIGLCLLSFFVYQNWLVFKDLKPGDSCCHYEEYDGINEEFTLEKITHIDIDEKGYTTKIYTKNGVFSFWKYLMYGITAVRAN